jgi:hypothetical protein
MPFDGTELGMFENHPLAKLDAVVSSASGLHENSPTAHEVCEVPDDAERLSGRGGDKPWSMGSNLAFRMPAAIGGSR